MDLLQTSLRLLGVALVPVAVSVLFYILKRKTAFYKIPYWAQQVIIGIVFGAAAIFGTEFGVPVGGATANARDAAPLCAGLIFGGPAGIIAGVIGGVERWIAAPWAGMYSQVACSVSTVLAGIYAAVLRKYMFDNKRPTVGFGIAIAIVMEVIHLSILFVTHLADSEQAYTIIKIVSIPMILANAVSVGLSILVVSIISHGFNRGRSEIKNIAQKVQVAMLICVVVAYIVTTGFVYVLQTTTARDNAKTVLQMNVSDVVTDVKETMNEGLLEITRKVADTIEKDPKIPLKDIATVQNVSEINVVAASGTIANSTNPDYIGFSMYSGDQSREFMVAFSRGEKEYVQEFQNISFDESDSSLAKKYAMRALNYNKGFVQVGYDRDALQSEIQARMFDITANRHIGQTGGVLIVDANGLIVSSLNNTGMRLKDSGITIRHDTPKETLFEGALFEVPCYWMYTSGEGYDFIAYMPVAEAMANRDAAAYVNSFMEVLVFAALFALIYFLIKKLVVNNIRSVNNSLKKIIGGNLDVTVDVRTSEEFSSLSDDINSTVTTLKHYIDEAAARIDKELEFAKNIQHSALPSVFPAYPNVKEFDIYATMNTAKEVGGDFYDFYMLGEDKLAFLIADVSGKGIPAAMFMMRAKTMIKNFAEEGHPVDEVFTLSNEKLCEGNDAGMFVTAWLGIMDIHTGHVTFANAGHNPPLIYRKGEGFTYLKSRAGLVLAGMEGLKYKLQEFDLRPGDRIYLYTDGVTEANDPEENLYGEPRLQDFLNANPDKSAKDTLLAVKADIDTFAREAEQFDDITMLMVDYYGKEEDMLEKIFPATDAALADVTAFVEGELEKADCPMKASMQISVCLEEIFVNVAHYAYPDKEGKVLVGVSVKDNTAIIRFTDDGIPFDPLKKEDPDITLSAEERSIGGLGIFMVKKTMDDVSYVNQDGKNILTIVKHF